MRLDLAGMAGWLSADQREVAWPNGVDASLDRVSAALAKKGKSSLATTLRGSVTATRDAALGHAGDRKPAKALLDLVDVVEKALR
jgi:hypothetical protein